jgi:hypothetical protein
MKNALSSTFFLINDVPLKAHVATPPRAAENTKPDNFKLY